jgi:hypothetical protein
LKNVQNYVPLTAEPLPVNQGQAFAPVVNQGPHSNDTIMIMDKLNAMEHRIMTNDTKLSEMTADIQKVLQVAQTPEGYADGDKVDKMIGLLERFLMKQGEGHAAPSSKADQGLDMLGKLSSSSDDAYNLLAKHIEHQNTWLPQEMEGVNKKLDEMQRRVDGHFMQMNSTVAQQAQASRSMSSVGKQSQSIGSDFDKAFEEVPHSTLMEMEPDEMAPNV